MQDEFDLPAVSVSKCACGLVKLGAATSGLGGQIGGRIVRRRFGDLERAAERVDQGLRDKRAAMVQAWRMEFADSLPVEEVIGLSREIHAGNPEALAAWETIRAGEEAYLQERAERRSG